MLPIRPPRVAPTARSHASLAIVTLHATLLVGCPGRWNVLLVDDAATLDAPVFEASVDTRLGEPPDGNTEGADAPARESFCGAPSPEAVLCEDFEGELTGTPVGSACRVVEAEQSRVGECTSSRSELTGLEWDLGSDFGEGDTVFLTMRVQFDAAPPDGRASGSVFAQLLGETTRLSIRRLANGAISVSAGGDLGVRPGAIAGPSIGPLVDGTWYCLSTRIRLGTSASTGRVSLMAASDASPGRFSGSSDGETTLEGERLDRFRAGAIVSGGEGTIRIDDVRISSSPQACP